MRLYIVRHGEAEPFNDNDASRLLTRKGIADTYVLGQYLAQQVHHWDAVLVSSYQRAQQTYAEIAKSYPPQPAIVSDQITPLNSVPEAFAVLHSVKHLSHVLLVSHMPLVSALVSALVKGSEQNLMEFAMHTSGLAVLELDELLPASAHLLEFTTPSYVI